MKKLIDLLKCKLCWGISITLFLALLVIEAILLVPSYYYFREQQLQVIEQRALTATKILLKMHADELRNAKTTRFIAHGNLISKESNLKGVSIYNNKGKIVAQFGEHPQLTLKNLKKQAALQRQEPGHYYFLTSKKIKFYRLWTQQQLQQPYEVVAVVDTAALSHLLQTFLWEIWDETVFVALLMTLISMLIIGLFLLRPILKAKSQLSQAIDDPTNPKRYLIQYAPNNELGAVFQIVNNLLIKINFFIQRLKKTKTIA